MIPQDTLSAFKRILGVVREMYPGSSPVIGGGALRDSYHNRPIKDVDVFLRAKDHDTLVHPDVKTVVPPGIAEYCCRPDVHGVWDVREPIEGFEVQLILADFDTQHSLSHTFDLGMSQIVFGGEVVGVTNAFLEDSQQRTFTRMLNTSGKEYDRTTARIKRLLLKYPEFKAA